MLYDNTSQKKLIFKISGLIVRFLKQHLLRIHTPPFQLLENVFYSIKANLMP